MFITVTLSGKDKLKAYIQISNIVRIVEIPPGVKTGYKSKERTVEPEAYTKFFTKIGTLDGYDVCVSETLEEIKKKIRDARFGDRLEAALK